MAHFDDAIPPDTASYGTDFSEAESTQVVQTASGHVFTNSRYSQPLRRANLNHDNQTREQSEAIFKWARALRGPGNSGLIRNWGLWNTTDGRMLPGDEVFITKDDQPLQNTTDLTFVGDASTLIFQTGLQFTLGSASAFRVEKKLQDGTTLSVPLASKILVAVNGVLQNDPADYTVVTTTGLVTFAVAPGSGLSVTWGGAIYMPARLVDDLTTLTIGGFDDNEIPLLVEEVRL